MSSETRVSEIALAALKPFYDAVFNDNGDISVTGPYPYEEAVAGYFAYKRLSTLETPPLAQDGAEAAAIEIADAVLTWMVKHEFLDADQEYRDDDVIEVLNDLILDDTTPPSQALNAGDGEAEWQRIVRTYGRETPVDDLALVLFETWCKADPTSVPAQYPASYIATFADMARAALTHPAAGRVNVSDERLVKAIDAFMPHAQVAFLWQAKGAKPGEVEAYRDAYWEVKNALTASLSNWGGE